MRRFISKSILKLMGWKISGNIPPEVKKCILIVAPHTSSTDFAIGRLACWYMNIDASFFNKKRIL